MTTILLVDDDPTSAVSCARCVSRICRACAENGPQALEIARAEPPDLVVLDVMLPGWTGWGVGACAGYHGAHSDADGTRCRARSHCRPG
jgi:CheY-like chemotaxis protein